MDEFVKLYTHPELGQILVKLDSCHETKRRQPKEEDDDEPLTATISHVEIRVFFKPKGLGVCSSAILFPDSVEGWEMAEKVFAMFDEAKAVEWVQNIVNDSPFSDLFEEARHG